jgi:membrane protein required for colicin V production
MRGFVREAVSIASLLIAVWAALNFGDYFGGISADWLDEPELQTWFGRLLVFVVVIALGSLASWGLSRLVSKSLLSVTDKAFGLIFGFARGAVLVAICAMAGQFAGLHLEDWWQDSALMPLVEEVADWIRIMAPKGVEIIQPDEYSDEFVGFN